MREFINKSKHKKCISSIPQSNENSIEFSLSTWTRSVVKSSQAKSLQLLVMSKIPMTDAPTCECDQRARECEVFWTQANGSPEHET